MKTYAYLTGCGFILLIILSNGILDQKNMLKVKRALLLPLPLNLVCSRKLDFPPQTYLKVHF